MNSSPRYSLTLAPWLKIYVSGKQKSPRHSNELSSEISKVFEAFSCHKFHVLVCTSDNLGMRWRPTQQFHSWIRNHEWKRHLRGNQEFPSTTKYDWTAGKQWKYEKSATRCVLITNRDVFSTDYDVNWNWHSGHEIRYDVYDYNNIVSS